MGQSYFINPCIPVEEFLKRIARFPRIEITEPEPFRTRLFPPKTTDFRRTKGSVWVTEIRLFVSCFDKKGIERDRYSVARHKENGAIGPPHIHSRMHP
jgi:hypothetical protein